MNSRTCRWRWQGTLVAAAALMAAACGGIRYPQQYLLDLQPPDPAVSAQRAPGPLVIREFQCPEYLCDGRIVYRPTPNEVGYYEYHRWAMSPRQMITESIAAGIQARRLFTTIRIADGEMDPAFRLTGRIERFEELDRGNDVHVLCVLSAQLVDERTRTILWNDSQSATVPVAERNVAGVVSSLTTATRAAVDGLVASLEKELLSAGTRR
jgi:ABC-type uncharacterized transport system auxiliary subunit